MESYIEKRVKICQELRLFSFCPWVSFFFEWEENLTLVKIFTPVPVCAANRPKQRLAVAVEMSVLENRNSGYT